MAELKPCPFCGGENVAMYSDFATNTYAVRCSGCSTVTWQYYAVKDEAVAAWNERLSDKELQKAEQEIHRQKRLKRIERNKVKRLAAEVERLKGGALGAGELC